MNVQTMTMPKAEAAERLRHYRKALHRRADAEYQAIADGYAALAKGTPILNLVDVMRSAPVDAKWRPRLAVARADQKQVQFQQWATNTRGSFITDTWATRHRTMARFTFDFGRRVPNDVSGHALVPIVPAEARAGHSQLSRFLVLWEVEEWADERIRSEADRDPYLLQPIGGDLYAVVAEWDLTELERAIMGGRRQ